MVTREFLTAGRAIFTVTSGTTGEHITYRIAHKKGSEKYPPAWFVSVLTGPENTSDYTFLGMLDPETGMVRLTRSSKYREDSRPVVVVRWALRKIWEHREFPAGYTVLHEGRCGRCGRLLTVPESIETGIGPECAKKGW